MLNAAGLARGIGVTGSTIAHYLDLLVDLLLVRRVQPWHRNVGKRLVKSPKIYIRDSGLPHA
jgi:predicted AAA+ superfamily ATPase